MKRGKRKEVRSKRGIGWPLYLAVVTFAWGFAGIGLGAALALTLLGVRILHPRSSRPSMIGP